MKSLFKNIFAIALVCLFASACSSDGDFPGSEEQAMSGKKDTKVGTRATTMPYYVILDIFTQRWGMDDYYTFLITEAYDCAEGETDPFPFYYYDDDPSQPRTVADCSQILLLQGDSKVEFDDRGFRSCVPYQYDVENGIGYHHTMQIGERIAVWASKESYTNEDLSLHGNDEEYFAKVSKSFKLCYITELKPHTYITYCMWEPGWNG